MPTGTPGQAAPCGTASRYGYGCRCDPCKAAQAARTRKWRTSNLEKAAVLAHANYKRRKARMGPEGTYQYYRTYNLKRDYDLSPEEYEKMFEAQGGLCLLCDKPETRRNQFRVCRMSVDHCHVTGKVRGLLCSSCNTKLGWFEKIGPDRIHRYLAGELQHAA